MKRILFIFFSICCAITMMAQSVTLNISEKPIRDVLQPFEQASGYHFFYNSTSLVGLDHIVSVAFDQTPLEVALNTLFQGTTIVYTIMDNNVIALSNKEKEQSVVGKTIDGVVVDATNFPIIGATVRVKNTDNGTITDFDGNFSLSNVKPGQYLQISYIGYKTYELRVAATTTSYNVTLQEDAEQLDEVVVVGYGAQKKVNLTGAVSVVTAEEVAGRPTQNMATALQGADPSLNITMNAGSPNSDFKIDIRGVASINSGVKPLVLVDGVEMDLKRVNNNDVESISVLKDASASAIYGAKAAAGVILVTTKKGAEGKAPTVTLDAKAGWKTQTTSTDFITDGFMSAYINDLFMHHHANYNMTTYNEADYAELWMRYGQTEEDPERPWAVAQSDGRYKYYANFNWYDHYYKKNRPMQDYNISVTGGNEKVNYYVSGRYYNEDGMIAINTDKWQNFSTRAKVNINIRPWLRYGVNFSFFNSKYTYPGTESVREVFRVGSLHALPFVPANNPDGTPVYMNYFVYNGAGTVGDGMNALLQYGGHKNAEKNNEMVIQNRLDIDLAKNLTLTADYSFKWRMKEISNRSVKVPYTDNVSGDLILMDSWRSVDYYKQTLARYNTHNYNIYLTWNPTWGQHHLTMMAGFNGENYRYHDLVVDRLDLLTEDLSNFNFATGELNELSEKVQEAVTNGVFGRINYDYAGKYLFEVSVRADGSSRFSKGHRWGVFPAGSMGWRMSEESFWEPISDVWSNSKLRFSAGQLGNQLVGYYDAYQTISVDNIFEQKITLDGATALQYATESAPNSGDLTWEKMTTYDIGVDWGFFRNRLNFTGDFYIRNTTDMLVAGKGLPSIYGASAPKINAADMQTIGWEIALSWRDNKKLGGHDFEYEVSAGLGDYQSTITKFDNPTKVIEAGYYEGMRLGEIWGFKTGGLFASDEAAAAYEVDQSLVYGDINLVTVDGKTGARAGDLIYLDLDGDGAIDNGAATADDYGDRVVIGNSLPRYSYNFRLGFDYFGFDFSMFWQGVGRRDWYPTNEATTFWGPYSRPYQGLIPEGFMDLVWSEHNPDAYFPRYRAYEALGSQNSLGQPNDRYLQNIGYLRFKNLTIGYTLPCWKKVFSEFRIYFSGENLWYTSPLKKYCNTIDPESAAALTQAITYGFAKSFTFGLTATF